MSEVKTDFDRHMADEEFRRLFLQEQTIGELTEMICREMKKQGVSRKELGERMGKTKGQISQMLNGSRNLTVRSLSDMLLALGKSLEPMMRPVGESKGRWIRITSSEQWRYYTVQADLRKEEQQLNVKMPFSIGQRGAA